MSLPLSTHQVSCLSLFSSLSLSLFLFSKLRQGTFLLSMFQKSNVGHRLFSGRQSSLSVWSMPGMPALAIHQPHNPGPPLGMPTEDPSGCSFPCLFLSPQIFPCSIMGNLLPSIPPSSPLACVLKNLKPLQLVPNLNAKHLVFFCNVSWPQYKLDNGSQWPESALSISLFLWDLDNFYGKIGKWSDVPYIQAFFFTLRPLPSLCSQCNPSQIFLISFPSTPSSSTGNADYSLSVDPSDLSPHHHLSEPAPSSPTEPISTQNPPPYVPPITTVPHIQSGLQFGPVANPQAPA